MAKCIAAGTRTKLLLTAAAVTMQLAYNGGGFVRGGSIAGHFAYTFLHANIWHLLANLLVLWSVRQRINAVAAYMVAVAASWLPMFTDRPTVGMSGMLFAMFGIIWGETGDFKGCLKAGMPVILVMMPFPSINALLHLYCYLAGFAVPVVARAARKCVKG